MIDPNLLTDSILFTDPADGTRVTFNARTFYTLVQQIMISYAGLSATDTATRLAATACLAFPRSVTDIVFLSHETEYHWAMLAAHGADYWRGDHPISPDLPAEYDAWETAILTEHGLAASSFDFSPDSN